MFAGILALALPLLKKLKLQIDQVLFSVLHHNEVENEKLLILQKQNLERQRENALIKQNAADSRVATAEAQGITGRELGTLKGQATKARNKVGVIDKKIADTNKGVIDLEFAKQQRREQQLSGAITLAASALALFSVVVQTINQIQNAATEAATEAIEKNKTVQAEIYENNLVIDNLTNLSEELETLDDSVIKTADTLNEIAEVREKLLDLFSEEERQSMDKMSNDELQYAAQQKATQKEIENKAKLLELENNITKARGTVDWFGMIGEYAALGTGIGAGIGMMTATPYGVAIGTAAGAISGAATGAVMAGIKQKEADDSKKIIEELLKSEEGLAQARFLYSEQMKMFTKGLGESGEAIMSLYQSILQTIDKDEMKKMMLDMGKSAAEFTQFMYETLAKHGDSIKKIGDDAYSYAEQLTALQEVLNDSAIPQEFKDGLIQMNTGLINLGRVFPTTIELLNKYG